MKTSDFYPFYERVADKLGLKTTGKVFLSLLTGMLFFIPYFVLAKRTALHDWSWLLGILISCGLLFLYFATATLRSLFFRWNLHIGEANSDVYLQPLTSTLSDRRFLAAGIVFGLLNLVMGICFGVTVVDQISRVWLYSGFFLAGFICGLPAYGIYGVVVTMNIITSDDRFHLDFTSPDRCGGMAFMGDALVKFSLLTLVEGILIATYILNAEWKFIENDWVQLLMWFWIAFPFILALLVLIAPAVSINKMLENYRNNQERQLLLRCHDLRIQAENPDLTNELRSFLRTEYAYLLQQREEVHKMNCWPFSSTTAASFLGGFVSNLIFAKNLAEKLLD